MPRQKPQAKTFFEKRDPAFITSLNTRLRPLLWRYFQPQITGLDRIPEGPCVFVANHNGAMLMPDMFVLGSALFEHGGISGLPYGLAHRLAMRLPGLERFLARIGAVPGTLDNGLALLRQGDRVLCYPGGELDSMRSYRDRDRVVFGNRRGYIKLALRGRVPIVPVVTAGAHETLRILDDGRWLAGLLRLQRFDLQAWPISLGLPWGLWIGIPPPHLPLPTRMRMEVLEPIAFEHGDDDVDFDPAMIENCHNQVHSRMEATLKKLYKETPDKRGDR